MGVAAENGLEHLGVCIKQQCHSIGKSVLDQRSRRCPPASCSGDTGVVKRRKRGEVFSQRLISHNRVIERAGWAGEIDLQPPVRKNPHPGDNDVEFIGQQAPDDVAEICPGKFDFDPDVLGELFGQLNLIADQLAVCVAHCPGLEQTDPDFHHLMQLDLVDDTVRSRPCVPAGTEQQGGHD